MSNKEYTSHSDIKQFLSCRLSWSFSSSMKMGLCPRLNKPSTPLITGVGVHLGLELFLKGLVNHPFEGYKIYVDSHDETELPIGYDEQVFNTELMLNHFMNEWYEEITKQYKFLYSEYPFEYELKNGYKLKGVIDAILEDRETGELVLLDWKTTSALGRVDINTDFQIPTYLYVATNVLKRNVNKFIYVQMSKSTPMLPSILKSKQVSVAKSQRTSPRLYKMQCEKVYGSWLSTPVEQKDCYKRLLEDLDNLPFRKGDKYFRMETVCKTREQLNHHMNNVNAIINEMTNPNTICYPSPGDRCQYCQFKGLCAEVSNFGYAIPDGLDFMDKKEYRQNEEWKIRMKQTFKIDVDNLDSKINVDND